VNNIDEKEGAICCRCNRAERVKAQDDIGIICAKCAMYLADHLENSFPMTALGEALKKGTLRQFMQTHRVKYKELERLSGVSYGILRQWADKREKVSNKEISEILASTGAGLREADCKTYI